MLRTLLMIFSMMLGTVFMPYTAGICASQEHVRAAENPLSTSSPMEEEKHSECGAQFEEGEIVTLGDFGHIQSSQSKRILRLEIGIQPFGLVGDIIEPPDEMKPRLS